MLLNFSTKKLFNSQNMLNISKLDILNTTIFMHKVYNETAPATFYKIVLEVPKINLTNCI